MALRKTRRALATVRTLTAAQIRRLVSFPFIRAEISSALRKAPRSVEIPASGEYVHFRIMDPRECAPGMYATIRVGRRGTLLRICTARADIKKRKEYNAFLSRMGINPKTGKARRRVTDSERRDMIYQMRSAGIIGGAKTQSVLVPKRRVEEAARKFSARPEVRRVVGAVSNEPTMRPRTLMTGWYIWESYPTRAMAEDEAAWLRAGGVPLPKEEGGGIAPVATKVMDAGERHGRRRFQVFYRQTGPARRKSDNPLTRNEAAHLLREARRLVSYAKGRKEGQHRSYLAGRASGLAKAVLTTRPTSARYARKVEGHAYWLRNAPVSANRLESVYRTTKIQLAQDVQRKLASHTGIKSSVICVGRYCDVEVDPKDAERARGWLQALGIRERVRRGGANPPVSETERRALIGCPATLDGEPAKIGGVRNRFATVGSLTSGQSAEFSWEAVRRICAAGGRFKTNGSRGNPRPCPPPKVLSRAGKCVTPIGYRAKRGKLYGWAKGLPQTRRHQILAAAVRKDGYATVIQRLTYLVNISADQPTRRAAAADRSWLQANRGRLGRAAANPVEKVLYGVKRGDEDWQEVILSTQPENFEKVKKLAPKDGYGRFRVAVIDLSKPPDFTKALKRRAPRRPKGGARQNPILATLGVNPPPDTVRVPFRPGQRIPVGKMRRWLDSLPNGPAKKAIKARFEQNMKQYRRFHLGAEPKEFIYQNIALGTFKDVTDIDFVTGEGKEFAAPYQVPPHSRKYDPKVDGRYVHAHGESGIDLTLRKPAKRSSLPDRFHTADGKFVGVVPSRNVKIGEWYEG